VETERRLTRLVAATAAGATEEAEAEEELASDAEEDLSAAAAAAGSSDKAAREDAVIVSERASAEEGGEKNGRPRFGRQRFVFRWGFFFFSPFTLSFLLSFNKRNLNRAARGTGLDPPSPPNAQRQKSMLVAARRWATTSPPSPSLSSPSLSPLLLSPLSLSLSLSLLLRCPCSPSSSTPRHRRRLCVVVSGLPLRLPSSPCSSASSLL